MSISGEYRTETATIRFELAKKNGGRWVRIRAACGAPLYESTRTGDIEVVRLLGGRVTLRGHVEDAEPLIDGDPAAIEELRSMDEALLIDELHAALVEELAPKESRMSCRVLRPNEERRFSTWGWGRTTRLLYRMCESGTWHTKSGRWFGKPVTVRNDSPDERLMLVCAEEIAHAELDPGMFTEPE